jgi:hypothetical protein
MSTQCRVVLGIVGMLLVACGSEEPVAPQPNWVTMHGEVRFDADEEPVDGAVLRVFEIRPADAPNLQLGLVITNSSGAYSIRFIIHCDKTYGVSVDAPFSGVTRASRSPIWPLPAEVCTAGDWPVNLWVQF